MSGEKSKVESEKLWGGRFKEATDKDVEIFNASISFDKRLSSYDIKGSIAHAKMLAAQGIISKKDADDIEKGLLVVAQEIKSGSFVFSLADEDVHMAVEKRLTEIVGLAGGRLHTARSRNDQVAVDVRLYLKDQIEKIQGAILTLMEVIVEKAEGNIDAIMPGYTHLQTAQPVLFSHYIMSYFQMLQRDYGRMSDIYRRMDYSPLGAGALAGTTFNIDRGFTAKELGFTAPTENSIDSVSDRDYSLEFMSAASICMMHLSRFSEELILYSSAEFSFIELSDDFCTGSSIMPQKKNPDIPELIRGKSGRVYGNMISLFTTMKGLPLAYNKDMQEDKEPLFDTVDTLYMSLSIYTPMIRKMKLKKENMLKAASKGYSTATDLADYLVRKGLPFRQAHHAVGKAVGFAVEKGCMLQELTLKELQTFSDLIEVDIFEYITVSASVNARKSYGGTATEAVLVQIDNGKAFINTVKKG